MRDTGDDKQNYGDENEPGNGAVICGSAWQPNSVSTKGSQKKRQSGVDVCFDRLWFVMFEENCFQETTSATIRWMKSVSPVWLFSEMLYLWKWRTYSHFVLCTCTLTHAYTLHAGDETGGSGLMSVDSGLQCGALLSMFLLKLSGKFIRFIFHFITETHISFIIIRSFCVEVLWCAHFLLWNNPLLLICRTRRFYVSLIKARRKHKAVWKSLYPGIRRRIVWDIGKDTQVYTGSDTRRPKFWHSPPWGCKILF